MQSSTIKLILYVVLLVLTIVCAVTVGYGGGLTGGGETVMSAHLSIDVWHLLMFNGLPSIAGQYYVMVTTVVLLLMNIIGMIYEVGKGGRSTAICVGAWGIILCLINAGLEGYYAFGLVSGQVIIICWAVAMALFVVSIFFYGAIIIVNRSSAPYFVQ